MEQRSTEPTVVERSGVSFLTSDEELTPGAVEALNRRTPEELEVLAERAARHS